MGRVSGRLADVLSVSLSRPNENFLFSLFPLFSLNCRLILPSQVISLLPIFILGFTFEEYHEGTEESKRDGKDHNLQSHLPPGL